MNIFRYDQSEVRTHEGEGQAWFCLNDVARALGIAQPKHFLSSEWCDKDGVRSTDLTDALGRVQETTFINEGNLYTLVSRSRKPSAIAFTKWVNQEVLPTLRKTGRYSLAQQDEIVLARLAAIEEKLDLLGRAPHLETAALEPMSARQKTILAGKESLRLEGHDWDTDDRARAYWWGIVYDIYEERTRTRVRYRARRAHMTIIEYIEREGDIEELAKIALGYLHCTRQHFGSPAHPALE